VPSISRTRRRRGWPSAFSCSGLSRMSTSRMGSVTATGPIYTVRSGGCLVWQPACGSRIRDDARAPLGRADQTRRGLGTWRLPEGPLDGLGFRLTGDQEQHFGRRAEHGHGQRDAVHERLELRLGCDRAPRALVQGRLVREERGRMAVRPDTEQNEIELNAFELGVVAGRCSLRAELALDPVR